MRHLFLTEEDMARFYKAFVSIPASIKGGGTPTPTAAQLDVTQAMALQQATTQGGP